MTNGLIYLFGISIVIQMFSLHLPLRTVDMIHVAGRTGYIQIAIKHWDNVGDVGVLTLVQHLPNTKVSTVDLHVYMYILAQLYAPTVALEQWVNNGSTYACRMNRVISPNTICMIVIQIYIMNEFYTNTFAIMFYMNNSSYIYLVSQSGFLIHSIKQNTRYIR